jgi:hypothetical protein
VEVVNDSPLAIAVAFTRPDLLTNRPPTDVPIQGIELPAGTIVMPVGHHTGVAVALAHDGRGPGSLPPGTAGADAVVRGWLAVIGRASRLDLPDDALVASVTAARGELLLGGPPQDGVDPAGYLVATGELVRLGQVEPRSVVDRVAPAAEAVARTAGFAADVGLTAAGFVLARAGERRALADVAAIVRRRGTPSPTPRLPPGGIVAVPAVEARLLRGGRLFPEGIPPSWRGRSVEAHGLVAGASSTLSFALRWHGEHPAVIWEVEGDPVALSAPAVHAAWRTDERSGEALWHHGPRPAARSASGPPSNLSA